jgi:hypothetical protein
MLHVVVVVEEIRILRLSEHQLGQDLSQFTPPCIGTSADYVEGLWLNESLSCFTQRVGNCLFEGFEVLRASASQCSFYRLHDKVPARRNGAGRASKLLSIARKEGHSDALKVLDRIVHKLYQ